MAWLFLMGNMTAAFAGGTKVRKHAKFTDSLYARAAYLAQLKYDSVILELITTGAVIAFVFRAFLGYKRLNERCVSSENTCFSKWTMFDDVGNAA